MTESFSDALCDLKCRGACFYEFICAVVLCEELQLVLPTGTFFKNEPSPRGHCIYKQMVVDLHSHRRSLQHLFPFRKAVNLTMKTKQTPENNASQMASQQR